MFSNVSIQRWRQFRSIEIELHDRLTILTGANGAGKTTILNMLNRHFGWNTKFISTPRRKKELVEYFSDYWSGEVPESDRTAPQDGHRQIGTITYRDGATARIRVPSEVTQEYKIQIDGQQALQGLFVSSHRPVFFYQRVEQIPTAPSARQQLLDQYLNEVRSRYSGGGRVQSPSYRLKEALISLAVFGFGNDVVTPNPQYQRTFEGFQEVLRTVLPDKFGFQRLSIEMPEVVLETQSNRFSLDAVSGGISAIIDLCWQIYMYSLEHSEFVVVIDEPENHLHPELQQTLLATLIEAFPTAQFIIATHNPFMVSSVPDSNVYVLRFDEDLNVFSEQLDVINRAGTANEILREVLGLEFTVPIWADRKLQELVERFSSTNLDEPKLAELRIELAEIGFSDALPKVLTDLVGRDQE